MGVRQAPLLTQEELLLVKTALILPVMLDVLQRDMNRLSRVRLRLDILFLKSLDKAQGKVYVELNELKAELRKRGIKVYEEVRAAEGIQAKFKCRGYDHKLLLLWDKVRTEILKKAANI